MRPEESFLGQSIRSLQTMLRVIAKTEPAQPPVIPDGIYGPNTTSAVAAFQRRRGLPVTGITDQQTWDAIADDYAPALILTQDAQSIDVIWENDQSYASGQEHPNLYLAQSMLLVLSKAYGGIPAPPVSGKFDPDTQNALTYFQRYHALPETGQLDKRTWHSLANQFPLASRIFLDSQKD